MASDVQLRVWVFAFGIILLFSGLLTMAVSNLSRNESYTRIIEYVGDDKPASWEVAAHFEKGDSIVVDYRPDMSWAETPFEFSDDYPDLQLKLIYFNITDPKGDNTLFSVILGKTPEQIQLGQVNIEVMRDYSSNGLNVSDYPEKIEGIAKYDGIYRVVATGLYPSSPDVTPPFFLSLSKKYSDTIYPLALLLPVGAVATLLGIGLTVWSMKRPKRQVTYRKTKTSRITSH